jgi:hypothetical protein
MFNGSEIPTSETYFAVSKNSNAEVRWKMKMNQPNKEIFDQLEASRHRDEMDKQDSQIED